MQRRESVRVSLREQLANPDLSVEKIAAQHFISVRQVYALFAEEGDSPAAYLRRLRLERAANLLNARLTTGATIRSIALECGYPDPASFARAFSRRYGVSPNRWAANKTLSASDAGQGIAYSDQ